MIVLGFLLHLSAAVMLLLFAVRMVRGGLERLAGKDIERILRRKGGQGRLVLGGIGMAFLLQSSAAVAVLVAGFTANGSVAFLTGFPIILGAELGSAVLAQLLSLPLDWLMPLALISGGWLFLNGVAKTARNVGRILLGVALVLVSLQFLRETIDPLRASTFLPAVAAYLDRDVLTALMLGAALAFIFHSGLAAVLTFVTLVQSGAVPVGAGMSLVLGANLGSALVVLWLTRRMAPEGQQLAIAAFVLRAMLAVIAAVGLAALDQAPFASVAPALVLLTTHIFFNLIVVVIGVASRLGLLRLVQKLRPASRTLVDELTTALDPSVMSVPALAIASMRRETLRMHEMLENMIAPVPGLLETPDDDRIAATIRIDHSLGAAVHELRSYAAQLPLADWTKQQVRSYNEIADYATSLDRARTIAAKRLLPQLRVRRLKAAHLDVASLNDLREAHLLVQSNLKLAANLLVSEDVAGARLLVLGKSRLATMERKSRKRLQRQVIHSGADGALDADLTLELMLALKDLNSQCASVGYRLLDRHGQLRETRLIGGKQNA